MNQQLEPPKIKFEDRPTFPLITAVIVFLYVFVYWMVANNKIVANDKLIEIWVDHNVWQTTTAVELVRSGKWQQLLSMVVLSTFAQINLWQLVGNMYFTWVFGTIVERRLEFGRYMVLVILGIFAPWLVLGIDTYLKASDSIYYFGPVYLITTILGAYLVFPPEKRIRLGSSMPKPRNEIFRRDPPVDITKKFGISPWNFIVFFVAFEIVAHFFVVNTWTGYDTVRLWPLAAALAIGYGIAWALICSITGVIREGPLKLLALRRYRELMRLDIKHEDALKGTSQALGLPYEKVRDWIAKTKNTMHVR